MGDVPQMSATLHFKDHVVNCARIARNSHVASVNLNNRTYPDLQLLVPVESLCVTEMEVRTESADAARFPN